jgi:thymidylate synthase (FAD)|tara:strand:- start:2105 stop:2746 length:642 start_codon:yes stop_codon:yes gene_type:complete
MTVTLIDRMGSDLTVVNAARVSFNKESEWVDGNLSGKDEKLIGYLARHGHWTPFGHCFAQFRIKAPVFVARQLIKHQVGLIWNEVSRRYVDYEPECWEPVVWREKPTNKKQGSTREGVASQDVMSHVYNDAIRHATDAYRYLIRSNVCPEQARAVLPQSMFTEWYWSGSLAAFSRVCKLRLSEDSQEETREIVDSIDTEMKAVFPISWRELCQ